MEEATDYQYLKSMYKKTTLCQYHYRGKCYFSACKFAHSVSSLKRYPIAEFKSIKNKFLELKCKKHSGKKIGNYLNEITLKNTALLYSSDEEEFIEYEASIRESMKEEVTKERENMRRGIMIDFMELLFNEMRERGEEYIKKEKVWEEFQYAHIKSDWNELENMEFIIMKKIQIMEEGNRKIDVVIPYPNGNNILQMFKCNIMKIIENYPTSIPISVEDHIQCYYDHIAGIGEFPLVLIKTKLGINSNLEFLHFLNAHHWDFLPKYITHETKEMGKSINTNISFFKLNNQSEIIEELQEFIRSKYSHLDVLSSKKIEKYIIEQKIIKKLPSKLNYSDIISEALIKLNYIKLVFPSFKLFMKTKGEKILNFNSSSSAKCL